MITIMQGNMKFQERAVFPEEETLHDGEYEELLDLIHSIDRRNTAKAT